MHYFDLTLLVLSINAIHGYIYSNIKENIASAHTSRTDTEDIPILQGLLNYFQDKKQDDVKDKKSVQNKASVLKNVAHAKNLDTGRNMLTSSKLTERSNDKYIGRHYSHIDPVFHSLKNRRSWHSMSVSSSDMEERDWKEEFTEKRLRQKFEAINSSLPRGDVVNIMAARPWGNKCGDPNQYDLPWGTCMLPAECDGEYRIYRGDSFCGRNQFVCCALERTAYDMYQGLDLSFERDNSLTTDTEDEENRDSRHQDHKKRHYEKRRKKRVKALLKKKIKNSITKIITEITKLLQRAYRNGTAHEAKMTEELKDFIKNMKKQYKKDRNTLVDAHEFNMTNYEIQLAVSLDKVQGLNEAFMSNDTFRDIVVNGTVNKENLLRLQRTHPVLSLFFNHRRMGSGDLEPGKIKLEAVGEISEPENIKLETEVEVPEPEKIKIETEGEVSEPENIKIDTEGEVSEPENIKLEMEGDVPEPVNIKLETEGEVSEPEKENPKLLEYDLEYGMLYY